MTTTDTTIETRWGRRITVEHRDENTVLEIVNTSTGRVLGAGLNPVEARQIAAALDPGRGTAGVQWTRDEFARLDIHPLSPAGEVIDEVVAWLNAHYPKPQPYDQGGVRGADSLLYRAERERDEAVARAEKAERERDEFRPTWDESVSFAYWVAGRLGCHVDDLDDLTLTEMAERAAAQPAPEVTRDDIENQLRIAYESGNHPIERIRVATAAVCDLFGVEAVDPVEEKARELYRAATPDARWETVADEYRRIARHVLGQEATR